MPAVGSDRDQAAAISRSQQRLAGQPLSAPGEPTPDPDCRLHQRTCISPPNMTRATGDGGRASPLRGQPVGQHRLGHLPDWCCAEGSLRFERLERRILLGMGRPAIQARRRVAAGVVPGIWRGVGYGSNLPWVPLGGLRHDRPATASPQWVRRVCTRIIPGLCPPPPVLMRASGMQSFDNQLRYRSRPLHGGERSRSAHWPMSATSTR